MSSYLTSRTPIAVPGIRPLTSANREVATGVSKNEPRPPSPIPEVDEMVGQSSDPDSAGSSTSSSSNRTHISVASGTSADGLINLPPEGEDTERESSGYSERSTVWSRCWDAFFCCWPRCGGTDEY